MVRIILHLAYGLNGDRLHGKFIAMLDGRQLCISREPLFAASRILLAEGMDPGTTIVTRHAASDWHSGEIDAMISTIGEAAKWTVREDEKTSPTLVRWRPFPDTRRNVLVH